jgi:hypothetical protein
VTRSSAKARPEIPLFSNLQEASSNEIRSAGIGTPSEGLSLCDSAFLQHGAAIVHPCPADPCSATLFPCFLPKIPCSDC